MRISSTHSNSETPVRNPGALVDNSKEEASKGPSKLGTGQREKSAIRGSEARFKFSLCRTHDLGTCLKGYMIEK